jgi:hypothetical protein
MGRQADRFPIRSACADRDRFVMTQPPPWLNFRCQLTSMQQLEHEIRSQVGRQRPFGRGGRPTRRPESPPEALADIDRLVTQIIRWYRALEPEVGADTERSSRRFASRRLFDSDQLPPQLRIRITEAVERLERVREAVQRDADGSWPKAEPNGKA